MQTNCPGNQYGGATARWVVVCAALFLSLGAFVLTGATARALESPETGEADQLSDTSARLNGVLSPGASEAAAGRFIYAEGTECAGPGSQETPRQQEGEGQARPFSARIVGLTPGKTYTACAVSENGEGARAVGSGRAFQTEDVGPEAALKVERVGDESVELRVTLSTHGEAGSLTAQYGLTPAYGLQTEPRSLAAAPTAVEEVLSVRGLEPDTRYHIRVVVTTPLGVFTGGDVPVVTQAAPVAGLPDGRRAELVTPLNGNDEGVFAPRVSRVLEETDGPETALPFAVAQDGSRIAYVAGPVSGGSGSNGEGEHGNEFLATRANNAWATQTLTPPGYYSARYEAFSPTLETAVLNVGREEILPPLVPQVPANTNVLYTEDVALSSFKPLFTERPAHYLSTGNSEEYETKGYRPLFFAGASDGFTESLFAADGVLGSNSAEPESEEDNLFISGGGSVEAVNVLPSQTIATPYATFGSPPVFNPVKKGLGPNLDHVISSDGSRVVWTDLVNKNLYMRVDPLTATAHTVQIDAAVEGGGEFQAATPDDAEILFSKAGSLYVYDANTGATTTIVSEGGVVGVLGASESAPLHVYFVASAALAPGAKAGSCEAAAESLEVREASRCNLYEYSVGHGLTFIAQLAANDGLSVPPYRDEGESIAAGDWQSDLGARTAEVTPSGEALLFMSEARIPTVNNPGGFENHGFGEVYLFDSKSGTTTCLSCGTEGQPLETQSHAGLFHGGGYLPISGQNTYQPTIMSPDGSRVFFDSAQPLTPLDVNQRSDVYEWEANGTGLCQEANGCVFLLTGGTDASSSFLIGASSTGDDVFVTSRAPLAGGAPAGDGVAQIFDLRAGAPESVAAFGECAPQAQCSFGSEELPASLPLATQSTETLGNFSAVKPAAAQHAKPRPKKKVSCKSHRSSKHGRCRSSRRPKASKRRA